jgi:periplasmic protein TonB
MNFAQERNPARQMTGFGLVVLLHVALIYALVSGLANRAMEVLKGPLEAKMIEQVKPPPPDVPPPPPPELAPPPQVFIPPPEVNIQTPPPPQQVIQAVSRVAPPPAEVRPVAPPAPPPAVPDQEVSARPISAQPLVYPPRMASTGREGSVDVECTVDTDGSTSNCAVLEAHGGDAFADAAMNYVKNAKYKPRIRNGVPLREDHHRFHIAFSLHE